MMERINVRVDRQTKQELEAVAREKGVTPSEVVRAILAEHLAKGRPRQESCLDVARRIGLVGVYKNTPTDLSTNPDHFEGFGG
jgi:metal-responsive CopG/Arc/MetJ family transcriptional regulator